jgi:hypothetical protein
MAVGGHGSRPAWGLVVGALLAGAGLLLGCHRHRQPIDNRVTTPLLTYQTAVILPTAGQPFTSVAPDAEAYIHVSGVGTIITQGFTFAVTPALPAGLQLDPATGIITADGSQIATVPAQPVPYQITASDSAGASAPFTVNLQVLAASTVTLSYNGGGAAAGVVGGTMVLPVPTVGNGTATGFGVSPALPAGMVLNPSTGLVSGSPTAPLLPGATYTLSVTTLNGSANAPFTLLVAAAPSPAPTGLSYPALPDGSVGNAYNGPAPTVTGSDLVYTVSPALPAGLALDALAGTISGTPAPGTSGAYELTVTASNATGGTTATVGLTIL